MTDDHQRATRDRGLDPADRPRALGLIFKRHGRRNVQATVPTRVTIYRQRTGLMENWEVIAWLPVRSEFVAWRRDTNYDYRLKAKECVADDDGLFDGKPVEFAERWDDEPIDYEDEVDEPVRLRLPAEPGDPEEETFLEALDLGLTEPNSQALAKYGKEPQPPSTDPRTT